MLPVTTVLLAASLVPVGYLVYAILWPYILSLPARKKLKHLSGPPGVFLLGNIPDLVRYPVHLVMAKWVEEYGKIFKLELPLLTAVVVTEPEAIAQMMKVDRLDKFTQAYAPLQKLTAHDRPNFLTVEMGPYYRAVRKALTPAFSSANLRQFFPVVVSLTKRLMGQLAAQGETVPVDMDRAAQRLTVDVIGIFAFDRDLEATTFGPNEALGVVSRLMWALQRSQNPLNRWFWWRQEAREIWRARVRYDALVQKAMDDLRMRPPAPNCMLHHLLSMTNPETGKPLTNTQLKCEIALLWIAGFETTAHAISWTLMYISAHDEVQSRLAAELDAAELLATPQRPEPRPLAWSDLGALSYLNAVIQESLRLMPPASGGTVRKTAHDTHLAGQPVPRDTMVWIPFYALQRSTRVWGPDANEFRPERWLEMKMTRLSGSGAANGTAADAADGVQQGSGDPGAAGPDDVDEVVKAAATQAARGWLPFSEGPRNCVGQSLALLELRVSLALLCGRFRFRLADEMGGVADVVAASRQEITLKPGDNSLLMHVVPRVP